MNLTDLRDELDARSLPDDDVLGSARLAGVQNRIQGIRRRRVAGVAAAAAVVAAVVIGYGALPRTSALPDPAATPSPSTVNGFSEYASGAKVVATASGSLHDTIRLTAVAGERGFAFTHRCSLTDEHLMVRWRIAGRNDSSGASCSTDSGGSYRPEPTFWTRAGIRPGDTVTFVAWVEWDGQKPRSTPLPDGAFSFAVMRRLAFEEYPLPPRPAVLQPLSEAPANISPTGAIGVVESDPADPNATRTVTVAVPPGASLDIGAQTPGTMRVLVDGKLLTTAEWWDYSLGINANLLRYGQKGTRPVTLTFQPEHMTGAWRAVIHR
ncbi:MAG TPA: hypothetical protein VFR67_17030 [Pilimelia sp.]|nr:hypothetical protein [Pilimelia sp.]